MRKQNIRNSIQNLAQHMENLLMEKHDINFARRSTGKSGWIWFNIMYKRSEKGLAEQHICVCLRENMIFFEATLPVTGMDPETMVQMVNELNLEYMYGSVHYDIRDGELCWTSYLPARNGEWPGNKTVLSEINTAMDMTVILYRKMLNN